MRRAILTVLCALTALAGFAAPAWAAPPLGVLAETGRARDGLPILRPHPDEEAIRTIASQGFGRTVLHLYQLIQVYLQKQGGPAPEPAYLLLKPGSLGFPRTGFYLNEQDRRHSDFTEVSPGRAGSGYSEAVRTFVHELNHTIVGRLAGRPSRGGRSTQMHSIGVRTDAQTAWTEGFAESFEVMFVEDPDSDQATVAWRQDPAAWADVQNRLEEYRSRLGAPLSPATITRLQFRRWYPAAEDRLRYHAVKANGFARQPAIPDRLLKARNLYGAYLTESILPGAPSDPPKSAQRMLQSEGVVSALFYRWATDEGLRNAYRDEPFYAQFGASAADVTPVENLYLKLFHVLATAKPGTAAEAVRAYQKQFPDEAARVDKVVSDILLEQPLPTSPEIWLANPNFKIGAMVFDQFRQLSHIHTFDLNAASLVDLLGVPGVDRTLAEAIRTGAPYASLEALQQGITPALIGRFRNMAASAEGMAHGDPSSLLLSFGSWLLFILGLALPPILPLMLFGLPAALWAWWGRSDGRRGRLKLLGWAAAALPAFSLLLPRF